MTRNDPPTGTCWRVGVKGDGSCPKLARYVHCRNCPEFSAAGRKLLDRQAPADYLDQWTELLAEQKTLRAGRTVSVVVFRVGEEWLAFRTVFLHTVCGVRPSHTLPHRTNPILQGMANIEGELLLCASLAGVLGIGAPEPRAAAEARRAARRMIVILGSDGRWVFPVHEVLGVRRLPEAALEEAPVTLTKAHTAYSKGVFSLGDFRVALLDEELVCNTLRRAVR